MEAPFTRLNIESQSVKLTDIQPESTGGAPTLMGKSMDALGFIDAPLLLDRGKDQFYRYEVIDGSRRIKQAATAGETEIMAVVVPDAQVRNEAGELDAGTLAAARLVRNMSRGSNPYHESQAIQTIKEEKGLEDWQIADVLGIPLQTIKKRLKLQDIPQPIADGLRAEKIAVSVAEEVANMDAEGQDAAAQQYLGNGQLRIKDVRAIRRQLRTAQMESLGNEVFSTPDADEAAGPAPQEDPEEDPSEAPAEETPDSPAEETPAEPAESPEEAQDERGPSFDPQAARRTFKRQAAALLAAGATVRELRDLLSEAYNDTK